jgi:photosystem II stability/assembly factor-like uncharacterized protein
MSTDGGSVWSAALESYYTDGGALVMDPNNSSVLYSGGYVYNPDTLVYTYVMAVSKSTDGGTNWHRDTLTTTYGMCSALKVDRTNSNIVYAGGYNGTLYKSTDAGNTWFLSNTGLSGTINDIKIGSTKANTIYAGSSSGVFKSTNAGSSWTNTGCTNVYDVLINPTNESEIYAATYTGVYKSTTGGGSWTAMNTGLVNANTTSLGIYSNNYLFAGTDGSGMYRWNIMVGADEQKTTGFKTMFTLGPNPTTGLTKIDYQLARTGHVNLAVYDIQGRLVKTLANANQAPGVHSAAWNGLDEQGISVASGIYFCRLDTGEEQMIQKLILVR